MIPPEMVVGPIMKDIHDMYLRGTWGRLPLFSDFSDNFVKGEL